MTEMILSLINKLAGAKEEIFTYITSAAGEEHKVYEVAYTCLDSVIAIMKLVNFLVPIDTLFTCCIIYLIMDIALFNAGAVNWVIRRIVDAIP